MNIGVIVLLGFVVVTLFLVVFVVVAQARRKNLSLQELNYIKSHWIRIIDIFGNNPVQAIIDADKLLDYVLKRNGFVGNVGEMLKKAGPRFSDLNKVWIAHKLRNRYAHELSGGVDVAEAKLALAYFKRALNDLGSKL
ncbi:hypothetical protein KJ632_00010 [Patescibacteria group bacterium]|nr:hypothetical protein [Patescibacteria group bacterium]